MGIGGVNLRGVAYGLFLLLFDPGEFFDRHRPGESLRAGAAVGLLTATLVTLGTAAVGWLFVSGIDVTITETVVEPLPEATCDNYGEGDRPRGCGIDEPVTEDVDVGSLVWRQFLGLLPFVFVTAVLAWVLVAVGLHVVSIAFDAEGGFGGTLAVAGFGALPGVAEAAAAVVREYVTVRRVLLTSNPGAYLRQLEDLSLGGSEGIVLAVGVTVTLWQAYVWTHGLTYARDLAFRDAAITAGVLAAISILLQVT